MDQSEQQYVSEIQALITGLPKYCASTSFTLSGASYTTPQVVALLQALLAAVSAKNQAKAAYLEAVAAERKLQGADNLVVSGLRATLLASFGTSPTTLDGLGISLRKKPAPLSAAALAAKAAKAKATREARGTTSKKQKATISGNVSGVTITPVVNGEAPSTASPSTPVVLSGSGTQFTGATSPSLSKA